mmetsp:Transcript_71755/g.120271  ORF Transcript_71755/g.120271 Transcript_71755/m.120271 type:complete len:83 (-) Transcript_71755:129-377(-)
MSVQVDESHFINVTVVPSPAAETMTSMDPLRVREPLMLNALGDPVIEDSTSKPPDWTSTLPLAKALVVYVLLVPKMFHVSVP